MADKHSDNNSDKNSRTIYVIEKGAYEDRYICGVATDKARAEFIRRQCESYRDNAWITEYEDGEYSCFHNYDFDEMDDACDGDCSVNGEHGECGEHRECGEHGEHREYVDDVEPLHVLYYEVVFDTCVRFRYVHKYYDRDGFEIRSDEDDSSLYIYHIKAESEEEAKRIGIEKSKEVFEEHIKDCLDSLERYLEQRLEKQLEKHPDNSADSKLEELYDLYQEFEGNEEVQKRIEKIPAFNEYVKEKDYTVWRRTQEFYTKGR